ncbi:MAG: hypothetical protein BGO49_20825 [Planctomycetales bacterium 71-10]|nr:MAG: hypothetical protein BGO49_20825 [Planctomycetales bacterium 71-10]
MTIHIPKDLESSIEAAVDRGDFASVDDAMAEAARLLVRELGRKPSPLQDREGPSDPLLGLMRDDVELMDEIVADAYRNRRDDQGREFDL